MNAVSILARRAARSNMGAIRWCVAEDNLWGFGASETKPLEVFLIAYETGPDGEQKLVNTRVLRTSSNYEHPWMEVVGGAVGVIHNGDAVGTIRAAWAEIRTQLESGDTNTAVELAARARNYFKGFRNVPILEQKQVESAMSRSPEVSREIFQIIGAVDGELTTQRLDVTSQLATSMALLALPSEQRSNDFLSAMLDGNAPLPSLANLNTLEEANVSAVELPKVAASRSKALDRLIGQSLGASDQFAPAYPEMSRTLSDLQNFLEIQVQRCALGLRPPQACQ